MTEKLKHLEGMAITLCGGFVEVDDGDVSSVIAVALIRLSEAVHMKKLTVGHLPIGVKYLLPFMDVAHTNHLQTLLKEKKGMVSNCKI